MTEKKKGTIQTVLQGFGFITPDDPGKDVHFNTRDWDGEGPPQEGDRVEFIATEGEKGPHAHTVYPSGEPRVAVPDRRPRTTPQSHTPGGRQPASSTTLPEACIFDSFYGDDDHLRQEIFYEAPERAAEAFTRAGLTTGQLRLLYQGLMAFVAPLRDGRTDFADAKERFGVFYTERVIRQEKRGQLPAIVRMLFEAHRDLALSHQKEMLGLFRYLTNILCYFGEQGKSR